MNAGRIEDDGPPRRVYMQPASLFTAGFMGEVNRIPVTAGQSPLGPLMPGTGTLCLRPEAIGTEGDLRLGPARLEEAVFYGTHVRARFAPRAAPDLTLIVHLPQGTMPAAGVETELYASNPVLL
jgi:spermidine/putrescine transport system ATP-binding protein